MLASNIPLRRFRHRRLTARGVLGSAPLLFAFLVSMRPLLSWPQESSDIVKIRVHADQQDGTLAPIWSFFGYDEPNYTYAPNGKKLLGEISTLSPAPAYVRVHNLLTSGDGSASLKWGSTNVYTEDAEGMPIYSWTIVDRIFDTFHAGGIKPLVEIGFMPEALSSHPHPYRHNFPHGDIFTGWAYPPKDYQKWAELVFEFVRHLCARYGEPEVKTWLWEVWNEPDIGYWRERRRNILSYTIFRWMQFCVRCQRPGLEAPNSTGPASPKAAEFLRQFLEHCAYQRNFVSGKTGSHLDFIAFHPKGSPKWESDHVRMGIAHQLDAIQQGFKIVQSFPKWRHTPIVLGESDPEGCAACSAKSNPQNSYRNGPLYAAYTVEVLDRTYAIAQREHVSLLGAVTWAFEFEDQPPFEGFRELATNGIDKPVLNSFRMFGLLGRERVKAISDGALQTEDVVREGVRGRPDINVIATRKNDEVDLLIWNYHDEDVAASPAAIDLEVYGLPAASTKGVLEHFRIDSDHSNAFTAWREMGSPQSPSTRQVEHLEKEGQLQLSGSPAPVSIEKRSLHLQFALPRQSLSLVRLTW